ncbi:MAG TPA: acetate--CoA ligase family protein [Casimicrobiaceae bacterium]|nr:acetate--CoA ligase family protein [Casimicrobiaceae bacterium]
MVGESDETRASIKALLQPSSIAIAGASSDPGKLGSLPLAFLLKHGYAGAIYPVHPKLDEITGLECYRSMAAIGGDVDLLVIAVPAARIVELLDACRPGQVKSALVLSSGFAEIGSEGVALQRELQRKAREKGIRFIGPNSVGVANLHEKVIPSISQVFDQAGLVPGGIGFVTQSGAVGTAITALAHAEDVGIGYFLSTGNEGDLEFSDFCDYFADDPRIGIIAGYVESIRDGDKFRAAARKAARAGKPIVLIKVGASEVGGRAVQSHTGALAGSEAVYRAAFDELDIVRAQSIEELIDVLKMMSAFPRTRRVGATGKVAILSHSGGAGVLMADTCIAEGLDVAAPSAALVERLGKRLPPYASFANPIDMTANVIFDPALMAATVRGVVQSGEYDAVMLAVNLIWRQGAALADELASLADSSEALVGVAWIAGKPEPLARLKRAGVPVFSDPVRCARAIAARLRWESRRRAVGVEKPAVAAPAGARADLTRFAAQEALLRNYGIDLVPCGVAPDLDRAKSIARTLGYPVAAKLVARNLAHKSEIGGVHLGIDSDAALERAFAALDAIPIAGKEGILVQRMAGGGQEIFVGMKRDDVFGPVIVVGLGGIYVEILRDTVMRLAPFDAVAAERLIRGSRFVAILDGARGQPKRDVPALAKIVARVSTLAVAQPTVLSLDLNPIVVGESGAQVVDFKFELNG